MESWPAQIRWGTPTAGARWGGGLQQSRYPTAGGWRLDRVGWWELHVFTSSYTQLSRSVVLVRPVNGAVSTSVLVSRESWRTFAERERAERAKPRRVRGEICGKFACRKSERERKFLRRKAPGYSCRITFLLRDSYRVVAITGGIPGVGLSTD